MQGAESQQNQKNRWAHFPRTSCFEVIKTAEKWGYKAYGWCFLGFDQHGSLVSIKILLRGSAHNILNRFAQN